MGMGWLCSFECEGSPDNVIYTNLGQGGDIDRRLGEAGRGQWTKPQGIIELPHGCGRDELVHRALKEFRAEQLPFKRFQSSAAFDYTVVLAFFLFESFERDVTSEVVPITARATRVRREAIDFAAKVMRQSGQTVLKVTAAIWERLKLPHRWDRAARPPCMAPT